MSVIGSSIIAGASGQGSSSNVALSLTNSLRFRSSASAYLSRTFATPTSSTVWTWSAWIKRGKLTGTYRLFGASTTTFLTFNSSDQLNLTINNVSAATSTAVFRDPSAWYHVVYQQNGSAQIIYVNNVSVATGTTAASIFNTAIAHQIGAANTANHFDGYMTEVNFIDGQALTPSSFGFTSLDTGVWIPKSYAGSYGTNGFYLKFTDNSALTSGSNVGLGKDFSVNGNYFNTNNISITSGITYDSMTDVPTLTSATVSNYATLNPLKIGAGVSLDSGNLNYSAGSNGIAMSTIGMSSGKWYCEYVMTNAGNGEVGVARDDININSYLGADNKGWNYYSGGQTYHNGSGASYGTTWGANDVISILFDADAGTLVYYVNGASQGTAFSGLTNGPYFFAIGAFNQDGKFNFGQRPFVYALPSGFKRLNTFNLPTPTIGTTEATLASKNMNVVTYTGTGAIRSVTGVEFQPDWTWIKGRSQATDHGLYDAVRGVQKQLESNTAGAETTETTGLTAFGSNGFTVGALAQLNTSSATYAGFNWKANGSGSANTAGTIPSTVSANTTAGFSIVTYTGTGSNATVGHGLGTAPKMLFVKSRTAGIVWVAGNSTIGFGNYLLLNTADATAVGGNVFNSTAPTSTVFSIGTGGGCNSGGDTYVAYCFSPVAGYSAIGSYTGNGSSDGPFVYLGFRPRFVMAKRTDTTGVWFTVDTVTNTYNPTQTFLQPHDSATELPYTAYDFLSNGFKIRNTSADQNASAGTYIYMAFAESPFNYANAR
jgi:hypothetical protein